MVLVSCIMKQSGDEISLFDQLSSMEFLTNLLSDLTEENQKGLSSCLKNIAHLSEDALLPEYVFDKSPLSLNLWKGLSAPSTALPTSGMSVSNLLAEQGGIDEIFLQKLNQLKNVLYDPSFYDDSLKHEDTFLLLVNNWRILLSNEQSLEANHSPCPEHIELELLKEFTQNFLTDSSNDTFSIGKHGRFYLDVWEERLYLSKIAPRSKIRPIQDWSELFQSYNEDFDGAYREWLVNLLDEEKTQFMKNPVKKRRKIDPIFVPYDVMLSAEDLEVLQKPKAPPVPVTITHPAAWGVTGNAASNAKSVIADEFQAIHPASIKITNAKRERKKRHHELDVGLDDFSVAVDKLLSELQIAEVGNMIRLLTIQKYLEYRKNVEAIKVRRQATEDVLCATHKMDNIRVSLRAMNNFRPVSEVLSTVSDHNGRQEKVKCLVNQPLSNRSLTELSVGTKLDYYSAERNSWKECAVLKLRKEKQLIRHAKVLCCGDSPSSSVWVSLEDDLLAPFGTYTSNN